VKTLATPSAIREPAPGRCGRQWRSRLAAAGHPVRLGEEVVAVRHANGRVISVVVKDRNGATLDVLGSEFISTMPIRELIAKLQPAAPSMVRAAADAARLPRLHHGECGGGPGSCLSGSRIYVHDPGVKVGRIGNFKNFSPAMVDDSGLTGLGMEYFCFEQDGMWSWPDADLLDLGRRELVALGIVRAEEVKAGMVYGNQRPIPFTTAPISHTSRSCANGCAALCRTCGWWGATDAITTTIRTTR